MPGIFLYRNVQELLSRGHPKEANVLAFSVPVDGVGEDAKSDNCVYHFVRGAPLITRARLCDKVAL